MIGLFAVSIFQSTLPHGSDFKILKPWNSVVAFQSTLPHGSDSVWSVLRLPFGYFNPRSLTGATFLVSTVIPFIQISIHAPSRERRRAFLWPRQRTGISIHAPSRERPSHNTHTFCYMHFNPRSLTGATEAKEKILKHRQISIHAPSRERRFFLPAQLLPRGISIHAPSRERHAKAAVIDCKRLISIHAPSRERHLQQALYWPVVSISIHAPSRERLLTCYSPT